MPTPVDQRDAQTWVILELNSLGEMKMDEGTLEGTLRRDLDVSPDFPIFVPMVSYRKGTRSTNIHLMEGYVFVGSGLADTAYFALERRGYVTQVITQLVGKRRVLQVVSNAQVEGLRKQLREKTAADIGISDQVRAVSGIYRNLEGKVIHLAKDVATVEIRLRSLELLATIPTIFLEPATEASGQENDSEP